MMLKSYSSRVLEGLKLLYAGSKEQFRDRLDKKQELPTQLLLSIDEGDAISDVEGIEENIIQGEITPENLEQALASHFFQNVEIVYIPIDETNLWGEPVQLCHALVNGISNLQTITLLIKVTDVESTWKRIQEWQRQLMPWPIELRCELHIEGDEITLTSLVEDSDQLNSVIKLADLARKNLLSLSFICWLNDSNFAFADDWLQWLESNEFKQFVFRFAKRANCSENSITFADEKIFHLIGFFDKIAHHRAVSHETRYYYKNLVSDLAKWGNEYSKLQQPEKNRVIFSLYQKPFYCSALNPLGKFGLPSKLPAQEMVNSGKSLILSPWRGQWKSLTRWIPYSSVIRGKYPNESQPHTWENVLITGWYGTETAGDKAILGELLHFLRLYNPDVKITISSIDEKVSKQTNRELDPLGNIQLIDIREASHPHFIQKMDAVIMGGGPLMESSQLENIWKIFRQANQQKIARVIFGCGVGPIHTARTERFIREICGLASAGFYRDEKSHAYALKLGGNPSLPWACDPSLGFLTRWRKQHPPRPLSAGAMSPQIVGLLREQTKEYYPASDLAQKNQWFAGQVAQTLGGVTQHFPAAQIALLSMHMYWKGNDDRLFNRKIARASAPDESVQVVREYLPIYTLLEALFQADLSIAMRYHGHLFSLALGIPFLSVNYTNRQGKVSYLLERMGYSFTEEFETYDAQRAFEKISTLISRRNEIQPLLLSQTEGMVSRLNQVYQEVFGAM